jgi:hypothetical protein
MRGHGTPDSNIAEIVTGPAVRVSRRAYVWGKLPTGVTSNLTRPG